jgi:uncharacterized protein
MRRLHDWYRRTSREDVRITEFDDSADASPHFGCQAGRDSLSISVTGEVSSCSKVLALSHNHLIAKLGDVRYGLTHLANRAQLVSCSRLRTACEALGIAADYSGGCLAVNYEENDDLFQPSLQDCAFSLLRRTGRAAWDEAPDSTEGPTAQQGGR